LQLLILVFRKPESRPDSDEGSNLDTHPRG
jgi:hypothetical protein